MAKPLLLTHTDSIMESTGTVSGNIIISSASDADGDPLTVARIDGGFVDDTGKKGGNTFVGTYGTLEIFQDGSYTYTLTSNIPNGVVVVEDFNVKIRDGTGLFASNVLQIQITGELNNAPVVVDDFYSVAGVTATGNVLDNDTDADGDALHVASIGLAPNATEHISGKGNTIVNGVYGTLTINDTGAFTYLLDTSDPDYIALGGAGGTETFAYKAGDGQEKPNMDYGIITISF